MQSQSLDFTGGQQYNETPSSHGKGAPHHQSSMGSLLTWKEEESQARQVTPRQQPPREPVQQESYQPVARVEKLQQPAKPVNYAHQAETGSTTGAKPPHKLDSQVQFEKEQATIQNIENNLLNLQMENKKMVMEFDKIPENAKTIAQRRRKGDLEREIKIINKNISSLKKKLRDLQAL